MIRNILIWYIEVYHNWLEIEWRIGTNNGHQNRMEILQNKGSSEKIKLGIVLIEQWKNYL